MATIKMVKGNKFADIAEDMVEGAIADGYSIVEKQKEPQKNAEKETTTTPTNDETKAETTANAKSSRTKRQ